jgi:hypothetical protein
MPVRENDGNDHRFSYHMGQGSAEFLLSEVPSSDY